MFLKNSHVDFNVQRALHKNTNTIIILIICSVKVSLPLSHRAVFSIW